MTSYMSKNLIHDSNVLIYDLIEIYDLNFNLCFLTCVAERKVQYKAVT